MTVVGLLAAVFSVVSRWSSPMFHAVIPVVLVWLLPTWFDAKQGPTR